MGCGEGEGRQEYMYVSEISDHTYFMHNVGR